MKWGSTKKIYVGEIYRSTNGKFIKIEAVNETHFRYMIVSCKKKRGRPNSHIAGAVFTVMRQTICNFVGPIEFLLKDFNMCGEW